MTAGEIECAVREAEAAESAYLAELNTDTLAAYVGAWDDALRLLTAEIDLELQAHVAHHAAVAHLQVFRRLGDREHAGIAIDLLERLRTLAPPDLAFAAVADLASVRFSLFLAGDRRYRLRRVVALHEEVLRRCPPGFDQRPVLAASLANVLVELARRDRSADVLDRAVDLHARALAEVDGAAAYRPAMLLNFATALTVRYQRAGDPADLEKAAALHRELSHGADDDHQVVVARCEVTWERYAAGGDRALLDEVVAQLGPVVEEVPESVPTWVTAASNLANALLEQQARTAEPTAAADLARRALAAAAPDSPERPRLHHVLGAAAWHTYLMTADLSRLNDAVGEWRAAVDSAEPPGLAYPGYLNSLAVGLLQRHAHLREDDDLRAALRYARRAVRGAELVAPTVAPALWNTLGHVLRARFERTHRGRDLREAVAAWERALGRCGAGAHLRPSLLASLGNGLRERSRLRGAAIDDDLQASVALLRASVTALAGGQEEAGQRVNLALSLLAVAERTSDGGRRRDALAELAVAVRLGRVIAPGEALRGGLTWLDAVTRPPSDPADVAAVAEAVLDVLRVLTATQLFPADKRAWLRPCTGIAATGAAGHAAAADPRAAVVALESGRALLLDEALPVTGRLRRDRVDLAVRYSAAMTRVGAAIRAAHGAGEARSVAPVRPVAASAPARARSARPQPVGRPAAG